MQFFKPYLTLCRIGVSALAACSAATGYILSSHHPSPAMMVPAAAVFLLACGSSALNQVQERRTDALMERTRQRPLPAGAMGPLHALIVSPMLMAAGLFLLGTAGPVPVALGLSAILWYNGLYTWLKKKTAFAAVPGAVIGAVPPAIGWTAAGGALPDARLFALCALFFLWQVPHFWLLVLRHGDEYVQAGLPSLGKVFSKRQLERLTFVWTIATAATAIALPLYGLTKSPAVYLLFVPASLWLAGISTVLLRREMLPAAYLSTFRRINIYLLIIMAALSLDSLIA
jgi:protoheme IX farnesyltransferase